MTRNHENIGPQNTQTNVTSQPSVSELGETSRICQINVEGMSRSKAEYLSKFSAEGNLNVLMVQETHAASLDDLNARGTIAGFDLIAAEHSSAHGIATYVKQGIAYVRVTESYKNNNIYVSVVSIGPLSITNVYKSPLATWTEPVLNIQQHPALYACDFNSHHTEWGYRTNDENGELVMTWATNGELQLVHDAKSLKTFHSKIHHTDSNPDLCFVSADSECVPLRCTREVLPAFPNSQHRPVIFEIGLNIPIVTSVPKPRWNFQKANWAQFACQLDAAVRFIPPLPQNYDRLVNLVISIGKKCIPRGYRIRGPRNCKRPTKIAR